MSRQFAGGSPAASRNGNGSVDTRRPRAGNTRSSSPFHANGRLALSLLLGFFAFPGWRLTGDLNTGCAAASRARDRNDQAEVLGSGGAGSRAGSWSYHHGGLRPAPGPGRTSQRHGPFQPDPRRFSERTKRGDARIVTPASARSSRLRRLAPRSQGNALSHTTPSRVRNGTDDQEGATGSSSCHARAPDPPVG